MTDTQDKHAPHPVKVLMSYGERILCSFTITEEISEHLKDGGMATITIGGHIREKNWSGCAHVVVSKVGA